MTPIKTTKFLKLLSQTELPTETLMPLLVDTLKALIPVLGVSVIRLNEQAEPTTYYTEIFDQESCHKFDMDGHRFASGDFPQANNTNTDPAAFCELFRHETPYGNLVPVSEAYLQGATYQYLFKPNNIYHVLDIEVKDKAKPVAILGLFREKKDPAFSNKELAIVGQIYTNLCLLFNRKTPEISHEQSEQWFLEKSTMITTDASGAIIAEAPEAIGLISNALACQSRAILNEQQVLPSQCLAFQQKVKSALSSLDNSVYLATPFGRLHLRAYPLGSTPNPERYGIHIEFYGDISEALLAYLRTVALPAKLIEIAYYVGMAKQFSELKAFLGLQNSSFKTYLSQLYAFFAVSDYEMLKAHLVQSAKQYAAEHNLRRHKIYND